MNPVNRYAEVAERELKDGSVREPVWNEVLLEAGGQEEAARELYQHRRVSQNLEIEEQHHAAEQALRKQRDLNDSLALSFPLKNALLGLGVIFMMVVAYLLMTK